MESRTFHPFPRLPKELRDYIWDLAIRPDGPSVHFFTFFENSNDAELSLLSQDSLSHLSACPSLAAPRVQTSDHQQQQFSWVKGNRSAYMIDSGLWTACTESRKAIRRRFKMADWDIKRAELEMHFSSNCERFPDAPVTASFRSNGELQCCLMHPGSDLFLLRPLVAKTIDWGDLHLTPIFDSLRGFCISHVAIDYDPQWFEKDCLPSRWWCHGTLSQETLSCAIEEPFNCAIGAATGELRGVENLWFVDYRIRRRLPTATSGRYTFHGNGCKLTEVRDGDIEWEIDDSANVFGFVSDVEDEEPYDWSGYDSDLDCCQSQRPNLGVLAYEEYET